jgi:diaminopimelate epimerase
VTGLDPRQRVVVRNAGGVAASTIAVRDGRWYPLLEGNATVVYRTEADRLGAQLGEIAWDAAENAAYQAADERNMAALKSAGVITARPSLAGG